MAVTPIEVHKGSGQRYRSTLRRVDGVVVELDGGSYNKIGGPVGRVPHDIAHFVVEERFGLDRGLWGVLAAGGIVQNASFVAGRRPPHSMRTAKAITDRAGEQLRQAEVLVRATADAALAHTPRAVDALRRATGQRWWAPAIDADTLEQACAELHTAARRWNELPDGGSLSLTWTRT